MSSVTQGQDTGDLIIFEEDNQYCRTKTGEVVLLDGSVVVVGTVLGIVTASGKYTNFDDTAADGTEDAAGVALEAASPDGADGTCIVLRRGPCVVKKDGLQWPGTADASEQAAAIVQLEALGILVRDSA